MTWPCGQRDLQVEQEKSVEVRFRGQNQLACSEPTSSSSEAVIVELKVARALEPHPRSATLNYLKATRFEVGLLAQLR